MNHSEIRKHFPILEKITYFDSAALVLKPKEASDAIYDYYVNKSISSRTADTPLGNEVNNTIQSVRMKVANLLDANQDEIIFTSGTTESINLFVNMIAQLLNEGDEILLSAYNHSSNLIPWIEMAKKVGAKIKISQNIYADINSKTKIVSLSHETNNFNQNFDIKQIAQKAHENNAYIFSDAAQSISHQKVSLEIVDAVAFSTNKFYGPTGMGVLAVKGELLTKLKPVKFGGGSVNAIDIDASWDMKCSISAYEPGTPDIAGFFMFDKSLDFFNQVGYKQSKEILLDLSIYLHDQLSKLENVDVYTKPGDYIALINVKGINAQDVATYLGTKNIYTIAGIFCAPYLRNIQEHYSFLRISLGIYNNKEDIDKLVEELKNGGDFYAF
ncbi:aminotransferase class V-fold PLP-dependent enzyme [Mycoplasmopsis verecunda]|uniref:Cysteine desulfurase / selenocysteine lyase n=1 Tax=Mycoplasmopsis verecunda TaxID=171291 RepID=A0A1T4KE77_9BACT|nr:aminotransferase class V-fold PLP-dependent enzyme [Mycoplasmopsis verecunda]WPB54872.1 aminotransferase class V-fold PLP-dependent enzyme [Mycoplasmopsis verecunda]SJZ40768.1 cysteine desulfurase / selenocysteine lyase [Mycoplasmopsis verecunda]